MKQLTDQGIAAIAKMKQLTRLSLWWAEDLTDSQLAQLAKLTALRELKMWGTPNITDVGLKHVSALPNLEALSFSGSRGVTPAGIDHLGRLRKLQEISMGYMPLKDDSLLSLSRIDSLEYVEMHGFEITDQGIQTLRNLTHLKRLYLDGSRSVTLDGVNKLKASLKADFELDP